MKKLRYLPLGIILALISLWLIGNAPQEAGYRVGDIATGFSLKNVDGQKVSPDDYPQAKGFAVIFTCNSCPYSKMYEERIKELHQNYEPKGFPVLAINPNDPDRKPEDSFEKMQKRAKEKRFKFPYLIDETQEIARAYGAKYTPHVFLLAKEGTALRVKYIGAIDDNYSDATAVKKTYVEHAIDDLLNDREVGEPFTKGIGCSIKWKS